MIKFATIMANCVENTVISENFVRNIELYQK